MKLYNIKLIDLTSVNTQSIQKLTKSLAVTASELLPSNLFALKTAFLSQSVQYIQSSNNVILNGCFNFSGEYNITLKTKEIYPLLNRSTKTYYSHEKHKILF